MPRLKHRKSKAEKRQTRIAVATRKEIRRGKAKSARSRFR